MVLTPKFFLHLGLCKIHSFHIFKIHLFVRLSTLGVPLGIFYAHSFGALDSIVSGQLGILYAQRLRHSRYTEWSKYFFYLGILSLEDTKRVDLEYFGCNTVFWQRNYKVWPAYLISLNFSCWSQTESFGFEILAVLSQLCKRKWCLLQIFPSLRAM